MSGDREYAAASMEAETSPPACPACGREAVIVEAPRGSGCLPFPPIEPLRCPDCGNTGTRLRMRERTIVQWARKG